MTSVVSKLTEIQARLDSLARQHKVVGASLGVMSGDEVVEFVYGLANKDTGLPVTNDTIFQIGSNTKVFTATLIMQLVDEGKVDLDAPARKYVPELKLADQKTADRITVRQLITHTSGIDAADYFDDFGLGDESLEKFVASLADKTFNFQPGDMWSYNNTAFSLAGRVIENVTGQPFRTAFHERLLDKLGMKLTTVRIQDMLRRNAAVGHVQPPGANEPVVTPQPLLPVATAPAGSLTASNCKEMFTFVRMHLNNGKGPDGKHVLSAESAKAMQQPQAKLPASSLGESMGLGWIIGNWDGEKVIGHGGGTIGQYSFLQVLPERKFGVLLLTNAPGGGLLWRDLGRWIFEELASVKMPELPKAPESPPKLDLSRYAGTYRRLHMDTELKVKNGKLVGTVVYKGSLATVGQPQEFALTPIDAETFVMGEAAGVAEFMDFDSNGRPGFVHAGGRVSKRASSRNGGARKNKAPAKKRAKPKR